MSTTLTLTNYPPERKVAVIKEVRGVTGLGLKEVKDLVEALPAVITIDTTHDPRETILALERIGAVFTCDQAEPTDAAHEVWSILDESDSKLRTAKSLLMTLRIALRNPELSLSNDDAAECLLPLRDLLDIIGDNIDIARERVRSLDATVPQVSS